MKKSVRLVLFLGLMLSTGVGACIPLIPTAIVTPMPTNIPTTVPTEPTVTMTSASPTTITNTATQETTSTKALPSTGNNPLEYRGFSFVTWIKGRFSSSEGKQSLYNLLALNGINCIQIVTHHYQLKATDTVFQDNFQTLSTASPEEITQVIQAAHQAGKCVFYRPALDLANDWSAHIGKGMNKNDANAWFQNYKSFIVSEAQIAQQNNVEVFSIGNELNYMVENFPDIWSAIIKNVRSIYSGKLIYSASSIDEAKKTSQKFWNALDYVGINYYPKLVNVDNPTLDQVKQGFEATVSEFQNLYSYVDKPYIITEAGTRPFADALKDPANFSTEGRILDINQQTLWYQGFFETIGTNPPKGLTGVLFWYWADRPKGGPQDNDYVVFEKPAEQVILNYWK